MEELLGWEGIVGMRGATVVVVCVSASNPVWCCMGSSAVRYAERRETLGGICSILSCASAVDLPSAVVKGASQKGGV